MFPTQSTHASTLPPNTLATYRWIPPDPVAAVFLIHGFRSHIHFNYLRSDSPTSLHNYGPPGSSLIRELNLRKVAVFAHDHVGHGNSTGLRAYFPSFALLVADLMSYVRAVDAELSLTQRGMPIFLLGHSLGGTVAIVAARDNPRVFAGMALSSAASEPPASMFGLAGRVQSALSGITSTLIPTRQLLRLPPSPDAELQALYEADPLNCREGLRARVGREILNAYADISARLGEVRTPFLTVSGEMDTLVNPAAAKRFYESAASEDKTYQQAAGRWHNLFIETGREEMWKVFADWIKQRVDKVNKTKS